MNATSHGEGSLKNFYGYKETFGRDTTWVQVPRELTFVHTNNPFEDAEDGPGGSAGYGEGDTTFLAGELDGFEGTGIGRPSQMTDAAYPAYATHGLEALSAVASQDQYSYAAPSAHMGPQSHASPQQQAMGRNANPNLPASQNLDYILNPASATATSPTISNIDPQLHSAEASPMKHSSVSSPDSHLPNLTQVRSRSYSSSQQRPRLHSKGSNHGGGTRRAAITDSELAFFLRDYAERMGLWMDIFDLGLFFSAHVPLLAVKCPLLLYSCVALSAKALARVNGRKPVMGGQVAATGQSTSEKWPGPPMSAEAWFHRARLYYDLAVSLLRQALAGTVRPPTSSLPEDASPGTVSSVQGYPLPSTDSDELVAATAILCVYEFFDISGVEWNRHLDGAKSLFDIANDRMRDLTRPPSPVGFVDQMARQLTNLASPRPSLSEGKRAVFWCFARQDMLSAFINSKTTRVDTSDLAAWRSAGLKVRPDGSLYPNNPRHPEYHAENAMTDDMVGNAFIWLLAKVVNFVIAPLAQESEHHNPLMLGSRRRDLFQAWEDLNDHLENWYEGLPASFTATAIQSAELGPDIEEKWFPRSSCASTMQWWHFAKIQMLHNKPELPVSDGPSGLSAGHKAAIPGVNLAQRHAAYASILRESREHAQEIVAIGLGRNDEGARVHAVQPLWTAGLVLGMGDDDRVGPDTEMWRRSIIRQLRGIERDMGWASEYRVQNLLEIWRLPTDWDPDRLGD